MTIGWDNAIAFVMIFGVLVFLHELGHFIVAKWSGVRVEIFSLGFGPRLFGWRTAQTDYRVSLVPLGGYVKMLGEDTEVELVTDPQDGTEDEARRRALSSGPAAPEDGEPEARSPAPDAFSSKPRWQRLLVMIAGGLMNIILAVLIVAGMNMTGRQEPRFLHETPRIASIVEASPAARAGLTRGDRVLAVNGVPLAGWEALQQQVLFSPGRTLVLRIDHEGIEKDVPVEVTLPPENAPQHRYQVGYIGLQEPAYDVRVARVSPGSAAEKAGLQPEDILLSIAGEPILTKEDVARIISGRPGLPTEILLQRGGSRRPVTATPANVDGRGLLGIQSGPTITVRQLALGEAILSSLEQNLARARLFFTVVGKLLTGGLSVRAVSGPVDIFIFSGEALRRGWNAYFDLMALFSLQLGILNLLPIPFLDGGHVAILGLEGILRRDLPSSLKERLLQAGFVGLLLLMGIVLYSDIAKNFDLFTRWLR
ncbi:MAG: RIP metalloprotease RseP [Acidobacteriota bacterium]